jgi:hypothetical protein
MGVLLRKPSSGVGCTERSELYHLEPASRLTLGRMTLGEGRALENGFLVEATGRQGRLAQIQKTRVRNLVSPSRSYSACGSARATSEFHIDVMMDELGGLPIIKPAGGWCMLFDVGQLGFGQLDATERALLRDSECCGSQSRSSSTTIIATS